MRIFSFFSFMILLFSIGFDASADAISHNSSRSNYSRLAGDPIPGVDVSLEQIPGGTFKTPEECVRKGGHVINRNGKQFCRMSQKMKTEISRDSFSRNPQNGK